MFGFCSFADLPHAGFPVSGVTVYPTGLVVYLRPSTVLVWEPVNDLQGDAIYIDLYQFVVDEAGNQILVVPGSGWALVDNTQTASWVQVNDAQTPNWRQILN